MIFSMTAFARQVIDGSHGRYTWEIRSVNHRYCEIFVRLPDELRGIEIALREQINSTLKRGKVDVTLKFEPNIEAGADITINEILVSQLLRAHEQISNAAGKTSEISAFDVLKWPGVLESNRVDTEALESEAKKGFKQALDDLVETRKREGQKLCDVIEQRCASIRTIVTELRDRVPEIIDSIKKRHEQRVADIAGDLDPSRIEQECALLMQKLDVDEELDRLEAHLEEIGRVLNGNAPAGRRLDFLMQELNREANTIGSKSSHIDTTNRSVDLKVLIEQIREQIQNVE